MTEYKKIVEEQAQKIQEENNNNALIGFGWQRESEEVRMLFASRTTKIDQSMSFLTKERKLSQNGSD
jgi:hypothetical protein